MGIKIALTNKYIINKNIFYLGILKKIVVHYAN